MISWLSSQHTIVWRKNENEPYCKQKRRERSRIYMHLDPFVYVNQWLNGFWNYSRTQSKDIYRCYSSCVFRQLICFGSFSSRRTNGSASQ